MPVTQTMRVVPVSAMAASRLAVPRDSRVTGLRVNGVPRTLTTDVDSRQSDRERGGIEHVAAHDLVAIGDLAEGGGMARQRAQSSAGGGRRRQKLATGRPGCSDQEDGGIRRNRRHGRASLDRRGTIRRSELLAALGIHVK